MNTSTLLVNALLAAALATDGASGQFAGEAQDLNPVMQELAAVDAQIEYELSRPTYEEIRCSCYGPGLYGNRTASGLRLWQHTTGVAHRRWPLGTELSLSQGMAAVPVRVIDRGPFANHAQLDLTEATVRAMGYSGCRQFGVRMMRIRKPDRSDEEFLAAAVDRYFDSRPSFVLGLSASALSGRLN